MAFGPGFRIPMSEGLRSLVTTLRGGKSARMIGIIARPTEATSAIWVSLRGDKGTRLPILPALWM